MDPYVRLLAGSLVKLVVVFYVYAPIGAFFKNKISFSW